MYTFDLVFSMNFNEVFLPLTAWYKLLPTVIINLIVGEGIFLLPRWKRGPVFVKIFGRAVSNMPLVKLDKNHCRLLWSGYFSLVELRRADPECETASCMVSR